MTALETFANRLQCTGLEARDLAEKGQAFAAVLVRLQAAYRTAHLDRSIRVYDALTALEAKRPSGEPFTTWQKLQRQKLWLSVGGEAKILWTTHREALVLYQELEFGRALFNLAIDKDHWVTALIEALHQAGWLPEPPAVAAGRDIYDRLNAHYYQQVADKLGLAQPAEERLWTR